MESDMRRFKGLERVFGRSRRSSMSNGLRNALVTVAGMAALGWWKKRQASRQANPDPIEQDPRQSHDTGQGSNI
jgi:hypothetical protein